MNRRSLVALGLMFAAASAGAQVRRAAGADSPTVEQAMDFLASQIELHDNIRTVERAGATGLRVARPVGMQSKDGAGEMLEFDLVDFDEHFISGSDALLNCARKGCVRYLSMDGQTTLRTANSVILQASSAERASRMVRAASFISERLGKKAAF